MIKKFRAKVSLCSLSNSLGCNGKVRRLQQHKSPFTNEHPSKESPRLGLWRVRAATHALVQPSSVTFFLLPNLTFFVVAFSWVPPVLHVLDGVSTAFRSISLRPDNGIFLFRDAAPGMFHITAKRNYELEFCCLSQKSTGGIVRILSENRWRTTRAKLGLSSDDMSLICSVYSAAAIQKTHIFLSIATVMPLRNFFNFKHQTFFRGSLRRSFLVVNDYRTWRFVGEPILRNA